MPAKTIETIPEVIAELRKLSKQIICPKDTYFSSMADTVEKLLVMVREGDLVVDDLAARVERLEKALRDIKRHYGHVSVNAGTGTLETFVDMVLQTPRPKAISEPEE